MAGASLAAIELEDAEVLKAIDTLQKAGGRLEPVWRDIGEYLLISTRERFDREQAPDGTPWEPLAESTLQRKMLKGVQRGKGKKRKRLTTRKGTLKTGAISAALNSKILVESGNLRDLMRYQIGQDGLKFGSDRIYAATHQFGDEKRDIPARPFLGLSEEDRQEILDILADHLKRVMESYHTG